VSSNAEPRQARPVRKTTVHDGGAGDQVAGKGTGARSLPHGGNVAKMRARISLPEAPNPSESAG